MAAVVPNVAGRAKPSMTGEDPTPTPHVDTTALLNTLSERKPGASFPFKSTSAWGEDRSAAVFDRWADVGPIDDAPSLMVGDAAEFRVQTSSDTFGEAVMATHVAPEMFGVLLYSRASRKYRVMAVPVSSSLSQWTFLDRQGARQTGTSRLVVDGVPLDIAALRLRDGAPAGSCLGFVGYQANKRIDGFLCRARRTGVGDSQASAVLGRIRVPWLIEP